MRFANLVVLLSRALQLLVLSALVTGLFAQATRLKLGTTIPGDLSEGQTRSYSVSGGDRRLNVLITRARQRCEVFTTLGPEDIDTAQFVLSHL